jgi:hypothetical protein
MMRKPGRFIKVVALAAIVFGACAPQAFIWHGQYVAISTVKRPKEDFKVGNFVVIGYNIKGSDSPYQFVIIEQGKQVGLITLDYHSFLEPFGFQYCLEEDNVRRSGTIPSLSTSGSHVTYQMYAVLPAYEKIKGDVITVLSGQPLDVPESKTK